MKHQRQHGRGFGRDADTIAAHGDARLVIGHQLDLQDFADIDRLAVRSRQQLVGGSERAQPTDDLVPDRVMGLQLVAHDRMHGRELVAKPMVELVDHQAPVMLLFVEAPYHAPVMFGGPNDEARRQAVKKKADDLLGDALAHEWKRRLEP